MRLLVFGTSGNGTTATVTATVDNVTVVTVPDVVGITQTSAEAAIVAATLAVGTITTQSDASVPAGNVISQLPIGGTMAAAASTIRPISM